MSELTRKDLHTPFNHTTISKLLGELDKGVSEQSVAADATLFVDRACPVDRAGNVMEAYYIQAAVAAAGESMSIDLQKNGVTVLTAPLVVDDTDAPGTRIPLPLSGDVDLAPGDVLTVVRDYTAGGGATPIGPNKVCVTWARGGRRVG